MIDYKLWKENIFSSINDISNIEFQEQSWLGKNGKYTSSCGEDISMLYDTFCFADDFWNEEHLENFGLSEKLLAQLRKLKELIDNYQKKSTDEETLKDPEWHKIVSQAKKIIQIWNS